MEDNKRYFIVYFTGLDNDKMLQRGKVHIFVDDGGFVNEGLIQRIAEKQFNLTDIFVYNIMELDKEDFEDFVGEYKGNVDVPDESINRNDKNLNRPDGDMDEYI